MKTTSARGAAANAAAAANLAAHIIAMADDAHLSGHPEWSEAIVPEARALLAKITGVMWPPTAPPQPTNSALNTTPPSRPTASMPPSAWPA